MQRISHDRLSGLCEQSSQVTCLIVKMLFIKGGNETCEKVTLLFLPKHDKQGVLVIKAKPNVDLKNITQQETVVVCPLLCSE